MTRCQPWTPDLEATALPTEPQLLPNITFTLVWGFKWSCSLKFIFYKLKKCSCTFIRRKFWRCLWRGLTEGYSLKIYLVTFPQQAYTFLLCRYTNQDSNLPQETSAKLTESKPLIRECRNGIKIGNLFKTICSNLTSSGNDQEVEFVSGDRCHFRFRLGHPSVTLSVWFYYIQKLEWQD